MFRPSWRSNRRDQRGFPAHSIAEVTEHDTAERSGNETDGERGEGQDLAHERIEAGEVQPGEDQGGRRPIEEKIIPLDGGAYRTGDHGFDGSRRLCGGLEASDACIYQLYKMSCGCIVAAQRASAWVTPQVRPR